MNKPKKVADLLASIRPVLKKERASKNLQFQYVSAGAGAGKTEWAIRHAKKLNKRKMNCLIVVPTVKLANSYTDRSGNTIIKIHNECVEGNVSGKIIDTIRELSCTHSPSKTIVITEKAFESTLMPFRMNKWILIKDEATEPLSIYEFDCPDSKDLLEQWFDFQEIKKGLGLRKVKTNYKTPVTTSDKDAILEKVHDIRSLLQNLNLEVLMDYEKLIRKEKAKMRYSVFNKPQIYEGFNTCIFMSANFEDTFLFHMYKDYGVIWEKINVLTETTIDSSRLTIKYWGQDSRWSKGLRTKQKKNTVSTYAVNYTKWVENCLAGSDFVYCQNNNDPEYFDQKHRMPALCHGLNEWLEKNTFVSVGSYLISNSDEKFYQYYGVSTSDAVSLRSTQMIYQQLMRTGLRVTTSNEPITVYVPTFSEVCDLLVYFPNGTIHDCNKPYAGAVTGVTGRLKPTWQGGHNAALQVQADPEVQIAMGSHTFAPLVTNICYWDQGQDAFCNYDNEFVSAKNSPTNTPYYYPIKTAITHYSPSSRGINEGRPKSGGSKLLRDIAGLNGDISMAGMTPEQKSVVKKNRLRLMVTGQFSDGATFEAEECRGNNSLLAFDLDNTDITNRQILKVFKAAETLIHTTPRHNPDADLRRIRVIVLCSRTMTIDEHGLLMKHYQSVFHKLSPNNHGVDPSKLTPWSKFYLPHRESTKYHNHKDKRPLDVDEILSKFPRPPIVLVPSLADIEYTYPAGINPQASSNCTLMTKCLNVVSQLRDGNRHIPSVKVGGMAKPLSIEQKHEIANQLQMMGASKEDLKGYWRYANQRR